MGIDLVPRIPDQTILAEIEDAVQSEAQLDDPQIRRKMCGSGRDQIAEDFTNFAGEAFQLCPNFALYWAVIRLGCRTGARALDLGRSFRSAGTYEFKRQWGAQPHPLPWIFLDTAPGAPPPVDRDASRFELLVRAWKRIPVPIAFAARRSIADFA